MLTRRSSFNQNISRLHRDVNEANQDRTLRHRSSSVPKNFRESTEIQQGVDAFLDPPTNDIDSGKNAFVKWAGTQQSPILKPICLTETKSNHSDSGCFLEDLPTEIFSNIINYLIFQDTPLTKIASISRPFCLQAIKFCHLQAVQVMNIEPTPDKSPFLLKRSSIFQQAAHLLIKLAVPTGCNLDHPVEHGREAHKFTWDELQSALELAKRHPTFGYDREPPKVTHEALERLFHSAKNAATYGFNTRCVDSNLLDAANTFKNWAAIGPIGFYRALQPWAKREAAVKDSQVGIAVVSFVYAYARKKKGFVLSNFCLNTLPREIGALTTVACMHVDGNRLKEVPFEICALPNLFSLHIQGNTLIQLPIKLKERKRLQIYYYTDPKDRVLPDALEQFRDVIYH